MNLHTLLYYLHTENGHAIVIIDIRNEYIYIYMRIILLPTDTEFEEEHPYITLLIKCACFKITNIDSECNE